MLGLISSEFLDILIQGFVSVLFLVVLSISARFLLVFYCRAFLLRKRSL
jgi:hypothetical protein